MTDPRHNTLSSSSPTPLAGRIGFIGGGNMASAIIGGLLGQGMPPAQIHVLEPASEARERLRQQGVGASAEADAHLDSCNLIVWAVKPQIFHAATQPVALHTASALHLSVAAGIRSDSIARWLGSDRVVRAMPNTPALVGRGMTGLFAGTGVSATDRAQVEALLRPSGQLMWLDDEALLDAVTALSGSGPAYVFFFLEAMVRAGTEMGLSPAQARQLAVATFAGAAAQVADTADPLETMRQRVTSQGGTTHAAISAMENDGLPAAFVRAMWAAHRRAGELGDEFGRN